MSGFLDSRTNTVSPDMPFEGMYSLKRALIICFVSAAQDIKRMGQSTKVVLSCSAAVSDINQNLKIEDWTILCICHFRKKQKEFF